MRTYNGTSWPTHRAKARQRKRSRLVQTRRAAADLRVVRRGGAA